jgi:hypothetical protein
MGLIDLKTDLKSLRYGKDRLGGGSSNQPYIKSKIPTNEGDLGAKGGPDFLLRGGLLTPGRILKDTSRLTQMFFDFRSPNGLLFTAKQNVLSLTNVNSFAGEDQPVTSGGRGIFGAIGSFIKNNIALNQGVYLPTSTILGAAGNPLGVHLNKQGLDPTKRTGPDSGKKDLFGVLGITDPLGLPLYTDTNSFNERIHKETKSRLVGFLNTRQNSSNSPLNLYSYRGGPGSILGVGKTTIYLSKDRTGDNNTISNTLIQNSNTFVLSGEQISKRTLSKFNPKIQEDFRKTSNPTLKAISYTSKNIEYRVNLGNPGMKGDISDYQKGKLLYGSNLYKPLDRITALPLYKSENVDTTKPINDLVKFRIGVIDNNNPSYKTYIHFRAFIDSMNDSYSADWQAQKFMGRGENFYRYNGFDRKVSLSWTVVAQSKAELIPMYQKLNYLASVCAPDYSDLGYMRGNLVELTVGGYIFNQPGIITSLTYDVPQESPWEIAIPSSEASSDSSNTSGFLSDNSVKELPHMIKVTGFQFIPIHNFVPSVQKNSFTENITKEEKDKNGKTIKKVLGNKGELDAFGDQRYIALSNGFDNNYKIVNPPVSPISPIQQKPITPLKTSTPLSTEIII